MRRQIALIAALLAASPAAAQQPDANTIRADIAADLADNTMGDISAQDVRDILNDIVDLVPTGAEVTGYISPFARTGSTDLVPPARLAAGGDTDDVLSRTATGQQWRTVTIPGGADIDARIASWAQATPTGTAPLSVMPYPDCAQGQILKRGQTAWACGADNDTDTDTMPATWALAVSPSGTVPFPRLPFPDCTLNQILKRGASAWSCAADQVGAGGGIDQPTALGLIATWARASSPSGTIPLPRLASGGSTNDILTHTGTGFGWSTPPSIPGNTEIDNRISPFARFQSSTLIPISRLATGGAVNDVLTRTGATAFGWRALPAIPGNSEIDARIESWARAGSTAAVPGARIDNALARDGELPAAVLVGQTRGPDTATVGQVLCRYQDGAGQDRADFDWCTLNHIVDASSMTISLTRTDVSTAAVQVPIAFAARDTDHDLSIVSGCVRAGTNGGGWYFYSANARVTPNRSDDTDPTDEGGPHRNFATWEIRRTRGAATSTIFHTTPYVRGYQTNSSPASQWVSFDGRVPVAAGDTLCVYVDASADSAHQADHITVSDGEVALTSDRWVFAP